MKKITTSLLIIVLFVWFENSFSQSVTVTLKPPVGALDDATVGTDHPDSNYADDTWITSMTWTCQSVLCLTRTFIKFDLSAIPSTAIVDSAFLYLYANIPHAGIPGQPMYGTDNAAWLRRVTSTWNENTITWNTQPVNTTQNQATIPQSTSPTEDYAINVTALVQDMINNPTSSFGFMFMEKNQTTYYNSLIFVSNDNLDTIRGPKLIITYTDAASVNDLYAMNYGIHIYPSPATDELTVQSARFNLQNVEIYNVIGSKVFSQQRQSSDPKLMTVNVSGLSKGIYFIKVKGQDLERTLKFVKQ